MCSVPRWTAGRPCSHVAHCASVYRAVQVGADRDLARRRLWASPNVWRGTDDERGALTVPNRMVETAKIAKARVRTHTTRAALQGP